MVEEEVQFFLPFYLIMGLNREFFFKKDSKLKFAILWLKKKSDSFLSFDSIMGLNPDIFL